MTASCSLALPNFAAEHPEDGSFSSFFYCSEIYFSAWSVFLLAEGSPISFSSSISPLAKFPPRVERLPPDSLDLLPPLLIFARMARLFTDLGLFSKLEFFPFQAVQPLFSTTSSFLAVVARFLRGDLFLLKFFLEVRPPFHY